MKNMLYLFTILSLLLSCDNTNYYALDDNKINPTSGEGFNNVGCPGAEYPNWETSPYVLPYPVGKSYKIDLSQCSGSYHSQGEPDEFAIDFHMNIGTLITCSRAGEVIYIEESGQDYGFPNNVVVVKHNDNTYAEYMHLTKDGAIVEVGDLVEQGDEIGFSGATGLAGYPHLHFVVVENNPNYPYTSIPYNFKNTRENPRSLVSGEIYSAEPY
ncbi:MAG: M23 family metallopeptidase [Flavobacteriales bacterium]